MPVGYPLAIAVVMFQAVAVVEAGALAGFGAEQQSDGVDIVRHQRPQGQTMQGGIIDKDMPVDASNVMIVCPDCGPTKIGARRDDEGRKYRVCRKCGRDLG